MLTANKLFETTKDVEINIPPKMAVTVQAVGEEPVTVYASDNERKIPVYTGHIIRKTIQLDGFCSLQLKSKKEFGYHLTLRPKQECEPHDHEAPPPVVETGNLLKQMRDKVRRDLGVTREAFLQRDTQLPGYEFEDEEDAIFEEDEIVLAKQEKKEKAIADQKAADAAAAAADDKLRNTNNNPPTNDQGSNGNDNPPTSAS